MAQFNPDFSFTGSVASFSFYQRRDSDKTFVRAKGGPKKKDFAKFPKLAKTIRLNTEFGRRSTVACQIRLAIQELKPLADFNFTGFLNAALIPVQKLDVEHAFGEKLARLSLYPQALRGFSLNRITPFESIVRNSPLATVCKETYSASIDLPRLVQGINFVVPATYPLFSFVAVLALMRDLTAEDKSFSVRAGSDDYLSTSSIETPWAPVSGGLEATTLNLTTTPSWPISECTMMLGLGIRFAKIGAGGLPEQIRHAGAAKIVDSI